MRWNALRSFGMLMMMSAALCAAQGPKDLQPTDPKTVTSAANPGAAPVPIDDLY